VAMQLVQQPVRCSLRWLCRVVSCRSIDWLTDHTQSHSLTFTVRNWRYNFSEWVFCTTRHDISGTHWARRSNRSFRICCN
jgi:hypothetical protein